MGRNSGNRDGLRSRRWERFRDGTLLPVLGAGIEGGFTTPPQERTFEVDTRLP